MTSMQHHYIDRTTRAIRPERLWGDRFLQWIYPKSCEDPTWMMRTLTSPRMTRWLGAMTYDRPFPSRRSVLRLASSLGIDLDECTESFEAFDTPRKLFERQIKYSTHRPMDDARDAIVSPADARVLIGSLSRTSQLFVKEKFFDLDDLLGSTKRLWREVFEGADFALCRLTPDKYHYNHVPVTGIVLDFYELDGLYHSCNPGAVMAVGQPYSKNSRAVTIIETDVPGGTGVGRVAMIEVVALMVGVVEQCYSALAYDKPQSVRPGLLVRKGQPKSRFRPGSSTVVLLFQRGRVRPCKDLILNQYRTDIPSRFSAGFGRPLVETDVQVRATIAHNRRNVHD